VSVLRRGGRSVEPDLSAVDTGPSLAETVDALASPALVPRQRRGLVSQLAVQAAQAVPRWRPGAILQWATDAVTSVAPRLPVRDLPTLQQHHGGLTGDLLAQRLIRNAARATAGVGAASGGLASVKWTVPPVLLSAPVLLGAETVAVVAIEVKLVGELHHAYGTPVPGEGPDLAVALLQSWASQRGIDPYLPGVGMGAVLGTAARTELRDRLSRRFGRNLTTLAPLLTGAAAASYLNQRATQMLGQRLRSDLWRPRAVPDRSR
jgi:hypothetical protein